MPLLHTTRLPDGAKFSPKRARRAVKFVEHACVHTKSSYAGQPFIMEDWQRGSAYKDDTDVWHLDGIITPLFGAMRYSEKWGCWVRNFGEAWIEMARKNGKSELMAALGLYLLIFDGEWGAEIFGAASDRDQACQVFDVARDMVYLSPMLSKMKQRGELVIVDSRKRIVYAPTRSYYRVVPADAAGNLGANPHGILFDEVLAQPDNKLWNYLRQGFGTRPQSLLIGITTAGPDQESFAYAEHEHGLRVAEDPNLDPKRFVYIAFADERDDWTDESHWGEANPALSTSGGFLDIDVLRREKTEILSKGDLAAAALFKVFHLNQWGIPASQWLDVFVWDESEQLAGTFNEEDLSGLRAVGAFDLAETTDFSSWVVVFFDEENKRILVKPRYWLTRQALDIKHKKRRARLLEWIDQGYVTLFEQPIHDYDAIRDTIVEDVGNYGIQMFGYDPWQAPAIVNHVQGQSGAVGVKIPQLTTRMDAGAKELTRLIGLRAITSNANPVLRWNVQNAGFKMDAEGHVKPHKANSTGNIDGLQALVIALTVELTAESPTPITMYYFPSCPRCDEDDIQINDTVHRCRDCGYVWEESVDD